MIWLTAAHAADPDDQWRWLEHERHGDVEAWWQARTEESRAWLAAEGRQDAITAWLAWERVHEANPTVLLDDQDGVSLWSRAEYVPPDPAPRWVEHLYVQRPGEEWPGTELPLDATLDRCMSLLLDGGRTVLGTRAPWTGEDEDRPCTLSIDDVDGTRRVIGTFDQPRVARSTDGGSLLVSHRRGPHRTSLSTLDLATGLTEEVFRTRRLLTPWAWRPEEGVLATSSWRTDGKRLRSLWILRGPADDLDWVGRGPFRPWFGEADFAGLRGDDILLRTDYFGEGENVLRVDPEHPGWSAWSVLTGERPGMDLMEARVHGDALLTVWAHDGLEVLEEAPYDGGAGQVIDLGGPVTGITIRRTLTPTALVTTWTPVGVRFFLRSLDGTYTNLREVALADATFRSVEIPSADGTMIPVSLVVPNGPPPPGGRPVLLSVYGGFGISQTAGGLGKLSRCWLAAGGVLGTVHARGGRERGDAWHDAATTTEHTKTFEDLIAAARSLVDQGIAGAGRVAVIGGSNGGLTVAAAVARDPAAFGAVIGSAGVYDLIHADRFGHWWPKEYGRPRDAEDLAVLRAESPVHNTPAGPLPPIWLHTGERDPVVAPAHSYKLAAAWADVPGGPVLLDVDPWGTHGGRPKVGRDEKERAEVDWTSVSDEDDAELLGFLFAAFDLDVPPIAE